MHSELRAQIGVGGGSYADRPIVANHEGTLCQKGHEPDLDRPVLPSRFPRARQRLATDLGGTPTVSFLLPLGHVTDSSAIRAAMVWGPQGKRLDDGTTVPRNRNLPWTRTKDHRSGITQVTEHLVRRQGPPTAPGIRAQSVEAVLQ